MAEEWYLMKSPHDQVSGYESEAFDDFAQEGFLEALETSFAVDVVLYNYDLTIGKKIRAVVQNNVQDTRLKTLNRQILVPIGTCKAGMYVLYKNRYWLIIGLVDDDMIYEKAVMTLCNYKLTWINDEGVILQRWCNVSSASQYNNGETSNQFYRVRSDQLLILTPDDDESLMINTGTRFIIDRRCDVYEKRFNNDVTCDTSNDVIVYKLTRADSVLFDYTNSGHFEFMAYEDEQHADDGYYVVDGKGYWLCEKPKDNKRIISSSKIECDSPEIYNGLEPTIFTARFYDEGGCEVSRYPQWDVDCDFADKLFIEYVDNSICISIDSKECINKSFNLLLSADGYETVSISVIIRAFI